MRSIYARAPSWSKPSRCQAMPCRSACHRSARSAGSSRAILTRPGERNPSKGRGLLLWLKLSAEQTPRRAKLVVAIGRVVPASASVSLQSVTASTATASDVCMRARFRAVESRIRSRCIGNVVRWGLDMGGRRLGLVARTPASERAAAREVPRPPSARVRGPRRLRGKTPNRAPPEDRRAGRRTRRATQRSARFPHPARARANRSRWWSPAWRRRVASSSPLSRSRSRRVKPRAVEQPISRRHVAHVGGEQ